MGKFPFNFNANFFNEISPFLFNWFFIRNKDLGLNPKVKKNLVKSQLCVKAALLLRSIKLIRYSSENIRVVAVARVECNKCSKQPQYSQGGCHRDRPRFFVQVGHQTTYASMGDKHFITK